MHTKPHPPHITPSLFPDPVAIEEIDVHGFESLEALFQRILFEIRKPRQTFFTYTNVHVANTAYHEPRLKSILQQSEFIYCDGAGIAMGAKLLGHDFPNRLPAADWLIELFETMARENLTVYLLGGDPGIAEKMEAILNEKVPHHTLAGYHHGYILNNPALAQNVIDDINRLKPDLLIVGFGTPFQEYWIDDHREKLQVQAILPLGAVMDYYTGKLPRCPEWMGELGLEWLFRLCAEPRRLFVRYCIGNPWFLLRVFTLALIASFGAGPFSKPATIQNSLMTRSE